MNKKIRSFRVWGLLALPLAAVIVAALMLAWGQSSTQTTQALNGANEPDLSIRGPGGCDTTATGAATCFVPVGSVFTIAVDIDNQGATTFPNGITSYQYFVQYSAGLTLKNNTPAPEQHAAQCAAAFAPNPTFPSESKGVDNYFGGCNIGVPASMNLPALPFEAGRVDFTCSATPSVQMVTLVHDTPVGSALGDDIGNLHEDPDPDEVLTINCTPPAEQININLTAADQTGKKLAGSCWLIYAFINTAPPQSPPNFVNQLISGISDNNAVAACNQGPLANDTDPSVGNIKITISGELRLSLGDDWHVQQAVAGVSPSNPNLTYNPDPTKFECDLSAGKCNLSVTNTRKDGNLNVNFTDFLSQPVAGQCVNIFSDPPANATAYGRACDNNPGNGETLVDANPAAGSIRVENAPAGAYGVVIDATKVPSTLILDPPDKVTCDVSLGVAQSCKASFTFSAAIPFNLMDPDLTNLFLTAQGTKLPPSSCNTSTDDQTFQLSLNRAPITPDPKGLDDRQVVNAFEFEVWFDEQWICVNIEPGAYAVNNGMTCLIDDKNDGQQLDGWARLGCFYVGKLTTTTVDETNLELANIVVRPQPELYSQIVPNQDNGIPVQLLVKGCNLADAHGHRIAKQDCPDAAVTIRWLEGDVNGDCVVDAADGQTMAFRWGAEVGSTLYNQRFDLQPSGTAKFDGDIDIKDVQFVFGRTGSVCSKSGSLADGTQPPQPPVNPKQSNP